MAPLRPCGHFELVALGSAAPGQSHTREGGRGQGAGAGLAQAQGTVPRDAWSVGEAEPGFPGWGSKQLEWAADETGRPCVPGEALWARPGC